MKKALVGYGGHAREVAAHISDYITYFVDDEYWSEDLIDVKPLSKFDPNEYEIMITISNAKLRKKIVEKLPKNTKYFNYIHPSVIMLSKINIGHGVFIGANCVLTTNIRIGNHVILNRNVNIGHDSVIGDYFSSMTGSVVSGNVSIGECVYLGNNSTVKEKTAICDNVIIGMNGAVVKHIKQEGTYCGVPVKKIK